tara:strand:+ start:3460 stop:3690 length:231 start_codon:yes stop_codon:yes gene_type:complete
MARLFLFLMFLALGIAIVLAVVSTLARLADSAGTALGPIWGSEKGNLMAPTPFQKISYVALLLVLLGVTSGWLGGL